MYNCLKNKLFIWLIVKWNFSLLILITREAFKTMFEIIMVLVELLRECRIRRLVFCHSCFIYDWKSMESEFYWNFSFLWLEYHPLLIDWWRGYPFDVVCKLLSFLQGTLQCWSDILLSRTGCNKKHSKRLLRRFNIWRFGLHIKPFYRWLSFGK